jgi:hypothetical protein
MSELGTRCAKSALWDTTKTEIMAKKQRSQQAAILKQYYINSALQNVVKSVRSSFKQLDLKTLIQTHHKRDAAKPRYASKPPRFWNTTRKILNTDGQNLSLKCKYSATKQARDGFDSVDNFLVSELLETDKIYL